MFDLTAGTLDRPFRDKHASATAFSLAAHVAIVGTIAWIVVFSVSETIPEVPVMMAFVAEAPAPPPPPPPPPPAAKAASPAQTAKPAPTHGPTFAAPVAIPVGIQPESGIELFDDEGGVVGGVEGGIPGGVLGGVLGGIVTDVMPPPPAPPKMPTRVGGDIKQPALIHRVEPEYPPVAVSGKIQGLVILEAEVNEAGVVTDVRVLRSAMMLLDQAAIKAVKQWRYQPLVLNGTPVPFILTVTLTFSLR